MGLSEGDGRLGMWALPDWECGHWAKAGPVCGSSSGSIGTPGMQHLQQSEHCEPVISPRTGDTTCPHSDPAQGPVTTPQLHYIWPS